MARKKKDNTAEIGFEQQIWSAADKLRGNIDASEYKNVVLGLIFLKYISDKFDQRHQELVDEGEGFEEDRGAVRIASKAFVEAPAEESSDEAALNPEALGAEALNVCYQYKGRYVVTSLKSGLAVIDQYRAHVRVLFDQYLASIRQRQGVSQQVLFPEIIEFTAAEATVLPALLESLRFAGFDLSDLGNDSYAINGLPAGMGNANPAQLVRDIVDRAMETGAEASGKVSEAIAFSLARAAAIRPG